MRAYPEQLGGGVNAQLPGLVPPDGGLKTTFAGSTRGVYTGGIKKNSHRFRLTAVATQHTFHNMTQAKNRPVRPARNLNVGVRLSLDEFTPISKAAYAAGLPVATMIRALALEALKQRRKGKR